MKPVCQSAYEPIQNPIKAHSGVLVYNLTLDVACHVATLWLRSAGFRFNKCKCKKRKSAHSLINPYALGRRSRRASLTAQKLIIINLSLFY